MVIDEDETAGTREDQWLDEMYTDAEKKEFNEHECLFEMVEYYEKLITQGSHDAEIYYKRADTQYKLKRYNEALDDYDKAIELGLNRSYVYYDRGHVNMALGRYRAAIADYDKALTHEPRYPVSLLMPDEHNDTVDFVKVMDDYDKAVEACGEAVTLAPYPPSVYQCRANASKKLAKLEAAMNT